MLANIDTEAARQFLHIAYDPGDWVALFLKSYDSGTESLSGSSRYDRLSAANASPGCSR
jgi:hypothetical protein